MKPVEFYHLSPEMELSKIYVYEDQKLITNKKFARNNVLYISNNIEETKVPIDFKESTSRTTLLSEVKAWLFYSYPDQPQDSLDWIVHQPHKTIKTLSARALFEVVEWNTMGSIAKIAFYNPEIRNMDFGWIKAMKECNVNTCTMAIELAREYGKKITNFWEHEGKIFEMLCLNCDFHEENPPGVEVIPRIAGNENPYEPMIVKKDMTKVHLAFCKPVVGRIWKAIKQTQLRSGPSIHESVLSDVQINDLFEEIQHIWKNNLYWIETPKGWILAEDKSMLSGSEEKNASLYAW